MCYKKVIWYYIQGVPTFSDFWYQKGIAKCGDHKLWGSFLVTLSRNKLLCPKHLGGLFESNKDENEYPWKIAYYQSVN